MARKRFGVILSGCGYLDGSEIHEAVLTLLALDRADVEAVCFAPDAEQRDVVHHVTGKPLGEKRNVLVEAARIARGQIADVRSARAHDLDGLVIPGGYGAAKNLCDFAVAGERVRPNEDVARLVRELHAERKPMGFWCIAPAIAAAVFQGSSVHPRLTIGDDAGTAARLSEMGAVHEAQPVTGITVDSVNRIVSTPCYMLAQRIKDIDAGVTRAVTALLELSIL